MKNKIIFASLLSLLLFTACKEKEVAIQKEEKFCITEDLKRKITIEEIGKQPVTEFLTLTGNVTYNTDNVVQFVSLVDGIITNTYFSLGDYVKKNQVLAEIKSTALNSLQSENKSEQSRLAVAQRQLEATESMFQDGIASQRDLIQAKSEVEILKSSLENIKQNLSLFSASTEKSVFQIKAPSDGYIVAKNMSSGMQISDNSEALFTISNLKEVWVMVNIYATNLQDIKENMEVNIRTPAYPNEIFKGKITALSQVFDAEEHVLKARIVMKNTDLKLKPGMSADIILSKNTNNEIMTAIPAKAMIFDGNRNYILLYKDDCNIEITEVIPFTKNNELLYFKDNTLEGKKVITKNHLLLFEKLKN